MNCRDDIGTDWDGIDGVSCSTRVPTQTSI